MRLFCFLGGADLVQDDFHSLFAEYGTVKRIIVPKDFETGKTRGFAIIDMPQEESAKRAMAQLHGTKLGQRRLTVSEAHGRQPRARESRPEASVDRAL